MFKPRFKQVALKFVLHSKFVPRKTQHSQNLFIVLPSIVGGKRSKGASFTDTLLRFRDNPKIACQVTTPKVTV